MLHPGSRTAASRRICSRGTAGWLTGSFNLFSTGRSGGRAEPVLQGDGQPGDGVDGHGRQAPSPVEPGLLRIAAQDHEYAAGRECVTQCGDGVERHVMDAGEARYEVVVSLGQFDFGDVRVLEAWAPVTGYPPDSARACAMASSDESIASTSMPR
ncbi:hypothetical protein SGRIM128S_07021 [Streptomyces griseomycini]